jgi:hypothetical protein
MSTAAEIAAHYDLTPSGSSFIGDCPSCGYRGFSVTEKDGRTLFYCHAGHCTQGEIISVLRDAGLWSASVTDLFEALDPAPETLPRRALERDSKNVEYALVVPVIDSAVFV